MKTDKSVQIVRLSTIMQEPLAQIPSIASHKHTELDNGNKRFLNSIEQSFSSIDWLFSSMDQLFASIAQPFSSIDWLVSSMDQLFASLAQPFTAGTEIIDNHKSDGVYAIQNGESIYVAHLF